MKHALRDAGIPLAILRDGNVSQVGSTGRHKSRPHSQTGLLAASQGVSTKLPEDEYVLLKKYFKTHIFKAI